MDIRPIPAFYCCYLLRSTIRHSNLYVGSTPNPPRRLAQHNGQVKGGAVRTSRDSLRPWEMTCIVAGFPSNIAALQFEWAWHNAHLTRHIPSDKRLTFATTRTTTSSRTGKTRQRPGRPRTSLTDKLSNLHLLLRTNYFSKWPLEVKFFCEDVYRVWQTWCHRVDGQIRAGITVRLDLKKHVPEKKADQPLAKRRKTDSMGSGGVEGVDPTYRSLETVLEKGRFVFDVSAQLRCDICKAPLVLDRELITLCPHGECRSISHVTCLAEKFLREDPVASLVPIRGSCPGCKLDTVWVDLMKDLSLRVRGGKEMGKLLKQRRRRGTSADQIININSDEDDDDDDEEEEEGGDSVRPLTFADVVDEDDDDASSVTSLDARFSDDSGILMGRPAAKAPRSGLETVIEDSDDEVEILSR